MTRIIANNTEFEEKISFIRYYSYTFAVFRELINRRFPGNIVTLQDAGLPQKPIDWDGRLKRSIGMVD
jgi:hypothetical protein